MKNATLLAVLFCAVLFSCKDETKKTGQVNEAVITKIDNETAYRPNYHFTPKKAWMNDPNGMFFYNGYYHLYFQHYPDSTVWGPMHWGHATSTDMIQWKEQPIALYPDDLGYIFSGSAVVDIDNASGFGVDGKTPIVAMYTSHDPKKVEAKAIDVETQSIAYSLDEGLTWTKYKNNPVIANPNLKDFRDPKVSWNKKLEQWVMVLAGGQEIQFFASKDLKDWKYLSNFGAGLGNHKGVWECPDLFELPVKGTDEKKWVLIVSIGTGGPNLGSATQYFIGDFKDGSFTIDKSYNKVIAEDHTNWVDFGRDNYAGVSWSNLETENGSKFFIGWMSNWQYANTVPTEQWRSAMTTPRVMQLILNNGSYRLVSTPVTELNKYTASTYNKDNLKVDKEILLTESKTIDLASTSIHFSISDSKDNGYVFTLANAVGDVLSFGYNHKEQNYFVNRKKSGNTGFSKEFASTITKAPRTTTNTKHSGTILLDKTSIELFLDEGETVITEIFFTNAPFETLTISPNHQEFVLDTLTMNTLNFN